MKNTILVLADPTEPQLAVLENLRAEANIITGNSVEEFGLAARDATVILNWSGSLALLQSGLWNVSEPALGAQPLRGSSTKRYSPSLSKDLSHSQMAQVFSAQPWPSSCSAQSCILPRTSTV